MNIITPNTLWEEKNLIELPRNYENKNESVTSDITKNTKTNSIQKRCNDIGKTKICSKCKIEKDFSEFFNDSTKPSGKASYCKICKSQCQSINRKQYDSNYYQKNKLTIIEKVKTYSEINKVKTKLSKKRWKNRNKQKLKYIHNKRLTTDVFYKLKLNLRSRFYHAIRGNYKSGSAVKDLGCDISFFKSFIESKFTDGMTWENWGRGMNGRKEWQIDHIKPLASFDLTDKKQLQEACHYTNLQPLWAIDNFIKSDK